jgi:hypothetical protein
MQFGACCCWSKGCNCNAQLQLQHADCGGCIFAVSDACALGCAALSHSKSLLWDRTDSSSRMFRFAMLRYTFWDVTIALGEGW